MSVSGSCRLDPVQITSLLLHEKIGDRKQAKKAEKKELKMGTTQKAKEQRQRSRINVNRIVHAYF